MTFINKQGFVYYTLNLTLLRQKKKLLHLFALNSKLPSIVTPCRLHTSLVVPRSNYTSELPLALLYHVVLFIAYLTPITVRKCPFCLSFNHLPPHLSMRMSSLGGQRPSLAPTMRWRACFALCRDSPVE